MTDTISSQIYSSRDEVRTQITEYIKSYLELENVDLTKSSFLSFIINIISTLTGNLMFYETSIYKEFFLTKAQLPESILNLSAFLGYNSQEASYSTANVLITIPFGFETTEENKRYTLPVDIDTEENTFSFVLPIRQYKTTVQEFQIDEDVSIYQFITVDVPLDGKVSAMTVEIRNPGDTDFTLWDEFNSLYLMSSTESGYVSRRTDEGRRLYFGNGLIGLQPTPGCTVKVTTSLTEGEDGNVIAGSIQSGERIYTTTLAGINQIVNYDVINTLPSANGEDEESLEEIRRNSISNLTAMGRLVSSNDYENTSVVIENSPLASKCLPVLKRSDLKVNDIQLFSTILFGSSSTETDNIIPTRNITHTIPLTTTYVPRGTEISVSGVSFYTLFDLTIDLLNTAAYYHYIMYELEQTPTLVSSYASEYNLYIDKLTVVKEGELGAFYLHYQSTESDPELSTCKMEDFVNDSTSSNFIYRFDPYTLIPDNEQTYYFTITDPSSVNIAKYSFDIVFRKSLSNFMLSSTYSDSTSTIIYDVPVVGKEYYDSISAKSFELQVLQQMMTSMDFTSYRMLTDFTNVKFVNTTGYIENMSYNLTTKSAVINIVSDLPTSPSLGDRYILKSNVGSHPDEIAQCTDATNVTWYYTIPISDDIVYVSALGIKYIMGETGWIPIPATYSMPLQINLEVFKDSTYTGATSTLATAVRAALVDAFSSRFGPNATIYRSEIIDTVHNVTGVNHCRLKNPQSSIFFSFELTDLTTEQLMLYGPEYVYFDTDSITIQVI